MKKQPILTPVRYREVAGMMSRPTFNKHYRKIVGDIYLHNEVADDPDMITAALLTRCPKGVLRGFAALRNMGFTINQEEWTPMISIPRNSQRMPTTGGKVLRLVERNVVSINGKRSVTAAQAVVDVFTTPESWGRWRDGTRIEEQVALIDHLLTQNLKLLVDLKNDPRTRDVVALANPLAESRPESIVRVRLHLAGFTEWRPQIKVRGKEKFYFVDIGDSVLQVGVEYQGAHHFDGKARARDAQRKNDLSWAGWTLLEATSTLLTDEGEWLMFLRQVREELVFAQQRRNRRLA